MPLSFLASLAGENFEVFAFGALATVSTLALMVILKLIDARKGDGA